MEYRLKEGSLHEQYIQSTQKLQMFGGAFANGKTAASCIKAINLSKLYPGSNGLIARETYPKLNDTIRAEFLKWCPKKTIKSFPTSSNGSNTCTFTNGSTINFRYIQQQNKNGGAQASTSNLLSATYDYIVVDQLEDPGIIFKDFEDLFGRLRGNTPLAITEANEKLCEMFGIDIRDLPSTGPRWFMGTVNPNMGWVYKKIVRPYHRYIKTGVVDPDLFCLRDGETKEPILDSEGKPQLRMDLFEGSTYTNAENLGKDFIETLESLYTGQSRDRFLLGQWAAYEGLIYPQFDENIHMITTRQIRKYLNSCLDARVQVRWIEGYDYGLAVPSCYLLAFVDHFGNVIVVDGFYEKELLIEDEYKDGVLVEGQITKIKQIRERWGLWDRDMDAIRADPACFKRPPNSKKGTASRTVAEMFRVMDDGTETGLLFSRGNNSINAGIQKIGKFLALRPNHLNPFNSDVASPHLYFDTKLEFVRDEFGTYMWKKDSSNTDVDTPIDKDDHSMDTIKYLLTDMQAPAMVHELTHKAIEYMSWQEVTQYEHTTAARYGHG